MIDFAVSREMDHVTWDVEGIFGAGDLDPESDRKIELGDDIVFPGLFHPHIGTARNIPIVRTGIIAALREEDVENRDGHMMDAYLVESRSIGGLSGSPVFVDLAAIKRAHQPTHGLMAAGSEMMPLWGRFRLIGVIHGHFDWNDKVPDTAIPLKDSEQGINTGIAIMIPSQKILENLEHAMKTEKAEKIDRPLFVHVADSGTQSNVSFQTTSTGYSVEVPSAQEFFEDLAKASRKKD
jgi:hypothetical protein